MSKLDDPRVLFAAERTLLAWSRTALSLIAFGFVMERSGLLIKAFGLTDPDENKAIFILILGIAMIIVGAIAAWLSARQYSIVLRSLDPEEYPPGYAPRAGLFINWFLFGLGSLLASVLIMARFI